MWWADEARMNFTGPGRGRASAEGYRCNGALRPRVKTRGCTDEEKFTGLGGFSGGEGSTLILVLIQFAA